MIRTIRPWKLRVDSRVKDSFEILWESPACRAGLLVAVTAGLLFGSLLAIVWAGLK
jgi:hypothetical protein